MTGIELGGGAVAAALLAGVTSALWVRSPAADLSRRVAAGDGDQGAGEWRYRGLWRARADAPPLGRRLLFSLCGALAIGLALGRVVEGSIWVSLLLAAGLTVTGVVVLGRLEPAQSRRRREQLVLELPHALELLSACLAAGMPLRQATRAVAEAFEGPVRDDLGQVLRLVQLGVSDTEAWRSLRDHGQWAAAAIDLARSVESGTMMVDVLVHHAGAARELRRAALEVRAKSVGVRSVLPLMTCFLPAFMLLGVIPTVASAVLAALF